MEWAIGLLSTIIGMVMGAFAAGIPLWVKLRKGMAEIREREKSYIEAQYDRSFNRVNLELDRLNKVCNMQEEKIEKLQKEHLKCIEENVELKSDSKLIKYQLEQCQLKLGIIPPTREIRERLLEKTEEQPALPKKDERRS